MYEYVLHYSRIHDNYEWMLRITVYKVPDLVESSMLRSVVVTVSGTRAGMLKRLVAFEASVSQIDGRICIWSDGWVDAGLSSNIISNRKYSFTSNRLRLLVEKRMRSKL